jgi:SAM-dependent methyltransferase
MTRYDGNAYYYHQAFAHYATGPSAFTVRELLGDRDGRWLDVGCGTGLHFDAIGTKGRWFVGLDLSADQLEIASGQDVPLVRADACAAPFADGTFDGVTATFVHTDVDDVAPVFAEAARVLRPGGAFLYLGTHPCFVGHFMDRRVPDRWVLREGYVDAGWHDSSPFYGPGLRRRVGSRHVPLAELVNAFVASGLVLEQLAEPSSNELVPGLIALVGSKPA